MNPLFPFLCWVCGEVVAGDSMLCPPCWQKFPWLPKGHCMRCSLPFASPVEEIHSCAHCLTDSLAVSQIHSLGIYQGVLLDLIVRMKYQRREQIAFALGREMAALPDSSGFDLIVPVPLHVSRLRQRGYNQAAWIAAGLGRAVGLGSSPFVLKKIRATVPQAGLSRAERMKNVQQGFSVCVPGEEVRDKKIMLVDDVCTTGATVDACARALLKQGAKEIQAYVVARAA